MNTMNVTDLMPTGHNPELGWQCQCEACLRREEAHRTGADACVICGRGLRTRRALFVPGGGYMATPTTREGGRVKNEAEVKADLAKMPNGYEYALDDAGVVWVGPTCAKKVRAAGGFLLTEKKLSKLLRDARAA